jgi:nicotinic acid phosphoribosyltransferase
MSVSLLATDGYKFSMAQAGWPLREETFYYAFRRGSAQVVPFDVEAFVRSIRPSAQAGEREYLATQEYTPSDAFDAAVARGAITVRAPPKGAWVLSHEPIATITGASALVSFFEPLLLQTHYRMQIATLALESRDALARAVATVTCEAQRAIVMETLDAVGVAAPAMRIDAEGYASRVRERALEIARAAGDGARIFEVGLRAASSMEQHLIALAACKEAGVTRTSNVLGAQRLAMVPVGTMGHEHVQRFFSDEAAFRAMKERRPQRSSFLLDTFDTIRSGLPAAFEIIAEDPAAHDSIRYDSGDKVAQYKIAVERARALGVRPVHVIEDGLGAADVARFEALREASGVAPNEQFYGSGGWLVSQTEGSGLTRDKVAAVYKLSKSGKRSVMKLSNDPGKVSVPGVPVAWRRVRGSGPAGIIAQEDEPVRDGYERLDRSSALGKPTDETVELSDATRALAEETKRAAFEAIERRKES